MNRRATFLLVLLVSAFAHAAEPIMEGMCSYTVQTPDGKFQVVLSDTLRILQGNPPDEAFVLPTDAPPSTVSFNCIRSSPVPAASDASVLDAGYGLFIAAPRSHGKPLVSLKKAEGRYLADIVRGSLSRADKRKLDAAVAAMNARADAPSQAGT
jgi:hypothetical protein